MRASAGRLLTERVTLLDAEPVLLVDDDQPEVGEPDVLLEQGMRADDDAGVAGEHVGERLAPRGDALGSGEQGHPGGVLGAAQPACLPEWPEHRADRPEVLLREDLGRGQQRGLSARIDDLQHGPDGDHGLARADLPLQQSVHRERAGQVRGDRLPGGALTVGEAERQARVERFGQSAGLPRARRGRHRGGCVPTLGERGLQHERLVPLKAVPRPAVVIGLQRPVNGLDRLGQPAQAVALAEFSGQRVRTDVEGVEQGPDRPGDLPGRDLGAGRVDRDQFGGVVRCDLGGETQPARLGQHLAVRVDQLPAAAERGDRAREQSHRLRAQHLLIEPGPVKERQGEAGRAVCDGHLQALAAPVAVRPPLGDRHLRQHSDVLALPQGGQLRQLAPGRVPAGIVPQQVPHGLQAERAAQGFGRLGPEHAVQRVTHG